MRVNQDPEYQRLTKAIANLKKQYETELAKLMEQRDSVSHKVSLSDPSRVHVLKQGSTRVTFEYQGKIFKARNISRTYDEWSLWNGDNCVVQNYRHVMTAKKIIKNLTS